MQHLRHLRVHPHELLGLAVHLDPVLQAEQLPLERLRRDRRHRDGHRPALADVGVGDLAVVVDEGRAKLLVALLGSVTRLANRPRLDELGEGDRPAPLCGLCGGRSRRGRLLVRVRDLGHPEPPPEPAARLPFVASKRRESQRTSQAKARPAARLNHGAVVAAFALALPVAALASTTFGYGTATINSAMGTPRVVLKVELARTHAERQQGLMNRPRWARRRGWSSSTPRPTAAATG